MNRTPDDLLRECEEIADRIRRVPMDVVFDINRATGIAWRLVAIVREQQRQIADLQKAVMIINERVR